jgi:hypothetical protein
VCGGLKDGFLCFFFFLFFIVSVFWTFSGALAGNGGWVRGNLDTRLCELSCFEMTILRGKWEELEGEGRRKTGAIRCMYNIV